jgi:replicative DNA helicase
MDMAKLNEKVISLEKQMLGGMLNDPQDAQIYLERGVVASSFRVWEHQLIFGAFLSAWETMPGSFPMMFVTVTEALERGAGISSQEAHNLILELVEGSDKEKLKDLVRELEQMKKEAEQNGNA